MTNTNDAKEDSVRILYEEWCQLYNKEVDETRFHNFFSNLVSMEAYSKKSGKQLKLNKWYDCTEEEYIARNSGQAGCLYDDESPVEMNLTDEIKEGVENPKLSKESMDEELDKDHIGKLHRLFH